MSTAIDAILAAVNRTSDSGEARNDYRRAARVFPARSAFESGSRWVIPSAGFAWARLIALAHRHEVMPLLNAALAGSVSVPASVRRQLESHCRTVIAHNLSLASELAELLELFERSGVSAVPFKGPRGPKLCMAIWLIARSATWIFLSIRLRPRELAIYSPDEVMFSPRNRKPSRSLSARTSN